MIPIFGIINKKKEEEKKFKIPDFTPLGIGATATIGVSLPKSLDYGYGLREDKSQKGLGYFGELKRLDNPNDISTELSVGAEIDGKETEIPSLVPTLNQGEINYLLSNPPDEKLWQTPIGKQILQKAVDYAKMRISQGKSPFAQQGEQSTLLGIKSGVGLGAGIGIKAGVSLPKPLGLPNLGLPSGPQSTPEMKPLIEGLPMSKPEDKPDLTWGNVIKYSLKAGLGQYQSSLTNVLRLIQMGAVKTTDTITNVFDPNWYDPNKDILLKSLTNIVEESDKIASESAEQAESKNWLKKLVSTGLQSAPQILGAAAMGAGMPVAGGIAAAKPTAEIATRLTQMIPFGIGAAGAHARDIEKEYESLGKEAPYLAMVAGGLLGGAGEVATELPVFLGVTKLLKAGGKALINEGAKNLLGKYGKLGIEFLKDVALQSWQEAEMVPIERAINKAVGLPQDMFKGLIKEMGVNAYGGLAMALVLGGLGGSAVGSALIANKVIESVDKVIINKGNIKEAIRKVAEIQGFIPEKVKPVPLAYTEKEREYAEKYNIPLEKVKVTEVPKEEFKETIGEKEIRELEKAIGKRPEDVLKKEKEPEIKEELKAKGKEPTIPSEIEKVIQRIEKLDIKEKEYSKSADDIQKTSPVGQLPDIFYTTLDKQLKIQEEKAKLWNGIRSKIIPTTNRTLWQAAADKKLSVVGYGEEEHLKFSAEDIRQLFTPELPKAEPLKKVEPTIEETPKTVIPKELEGLAEEARKYGNAEEFVKLFTQEELPSSFAFSLPNIKVKGKIPLISIKGEFQTADGKIIQGERLLRLPNVGQKIDATKIFIEKRYGSLADFYTQATAGVKAEGKGEATIPVTEKPAGVEVTEKVTEVSKDFTKLLLNEEKYSEKFAKQEIKQYEKEVGYYDFVAQEIKLPQRFAKEEMKEYQKFLKEEVPQTFVEKIPNLNEIGIKELIRPAWRVFQKIGIYDEVFKPSFEAEINTSEDLIKFNEDITKLRDTVGKSKEETKKLFNAIENPKLYNTLTPQEKKVVDWGIKFFEDWANKLKLEPEERREKYITHIFEKEIEQSLKDKYPLDPNIVSALDFITPKTIFNPYLQARLGKKVGLKEDFFASLNAYEGRALKKFYYEPLIQRIRIYTKYLPPNSQRYLRDYITRITARPLIIDREVNQSLKEIAQVIKKLPGGQRLATVLTQGNPSGLLAYNLTGIYYEAYMGLRPLTAIKNFSQQGLTLAEVGPKAYVQALTFTDLKERKRLLNQSLVLKSRKSGYLPGIDETFIKQLENKRRNVTMFMFKIAEGLNISNAFLGGYFEAKNKGLPEDIRFKRGDEVAQKTQYLYTKLAGTQFAQSSPGRLLSAFTTWPLNWAEIMTDWIQGKPSEVYKEYEKTSGKKITPDNWFLKRKALWIYLSLVVLAGLIQRKTRLKALDYVGWTALRNLADIVSGKVAGLNIPGALARLAAGLAMGDTKTAKTAWNEIRPDRFVVITKELEDIINGKKDWMNLFVSLEKKKKAKPEPIIIGKPSISKFSIPKFGKSNISKFSIPKFGK